jgi:2-(1,2-epoxy-1,2-dihydrophenyl)acetyl-CoA isomerase
MSSTPESAPLLRERHGSVLLVTINRPETRNALSGEAMFAAFEDLVRQLNADLQIKAAILTGAGSAFCSGGNVAEMRDRTGMFAGTPDEIAEQYRRGIQRIPLALSTLEVPIIAAINGPAIGAGNDLACMCDLRIASTRARFAESFVKLGIIPGDGGCWLLPRVVEYATAAELALTGETIDAQKALQIGLVSRVVEPDDLLTVALGLAQGIAANPSQTVRTTKRLLRQAQTSSLAEALEAAAVAQGFAHHSEEHALAVAAFFQPRASR